jgi:hypothetical protein
MKRRNISILAVFFTFLIVLSCKKDNFEAPTSMLTGRVVYQGEPIGLRSGGVELELWQHGYQLFTKIPVYIDQNGAFSARLFDGDYKLVLLRGNGPWADNTDSLNISLKGSLNLDLQVNPFFVINNQSIQVSGTNANATVNIQQVNTSRTLERVALYLGKTTIVDQNNFEARIDITAANIPNINGPINLSLAIPASLRDKGYGYARVGVKSTGVAEYIYGSVQKLDF